MVILGGLRRFDPLRETSVFGGIFFVGVENVLYISFTVREIKSFDVRYRSEKADDGFVGLNVSH